MQESWIDGVRKFLGDEYRQSIRLAVMRAIEAMKYALPNPPLALQSEGHYTAMVAQWADMFSNACIEPVKIDNAVTQALAELDYFPSFRRFADFVLGEGWQNYSFPTYRLTMTHDPSTGECLWMWMKKGAPLHEIGTKYPLIYEPTEDERREIEALAEAMPKPPVLPKPPKAPEEFYRQIVG